MSALLPGPRRDLFHATRQLKGARKSLACLRIALRDEVDQLVLDALVTLDCVLVDLAKVRRMAAKKTGRKEAA